MTTTTTAAAGSILALLAPAVVADDDTEDSPGAERRKNWAHASNAFVQRQYCMVIGNVAMIVLSLVLYSNYLRAHVPPVWAMVFVVFFFVVGLLYDPSSGNHLNEVLAFLSGAAFFLVTRIVRTRTRLGDCQCRLCAREVLVTDKLGEGSFGSIYKCRTTAKASEGRNVTCVVKRVPVDFDKDINDASEVKSAILCCLSSKYLKYSDATVTGPPGGQELDPTGHAPARCDLHGHVAAQGHTGVAFHARHQRAVHHDGVLPKW